MSLAYILKTNQEVQRECANVEKYLDEFLAFAHKDIAEGALHTLHAGGKRLRPAILIMTASFYDNAKNVVPLAAAMEIVHMSSLIHDDIIDQSPTRRGQATLFKQIGAYRALHSGDYILSKALQMVNDLPHGQEMMQILGNLSCEMCYGEVEQINSMYDVKQTLEDYYYRINRKTALLFAACCQLGALASEASAEEIQTFYDIGYNMGMAFQIKDDILDMEMSAKDLGKPAGNDLAQGIMTLPTILVLAKDFPERLRLLELIENKFAGGQSEVEEALAIIKENNGIIEANDYCNRYIDEAKRLIEQLPEKKGKKGFVLSAKYVIERGF